MSSYDFNSVCGDFSQKCECMKENEPVYPAFVYNIMASTCRNVRKMLRSIIYMCKL